MAGILENVIWLREMLGWLGWVLFEMERVKVERW